MNRELHARIGVLDAERGAIRTDFPEGAHVILSNPSGIDLDSEFAIRLRTKTEDLVTIEIHGNDSGVTTALFLPSFPELPIEPVIFLFDMVSPERIPLSVEVCRSQV